MQKQAWHLRNAYLSGERNVSVRALATVEAVAEAEREITETAKRAAAAATADRVARTAAAAAATQQAADAVGVLVEGMPNKPYNGIYAQAGEHEGFPRYENESGKHLYQLQLQDLAWEKNWLGKQHCPQQWVFRRQLEEWGEWGESGPQNGESQVRACIDAPGGAIPTGSRPWNVLRGGHYDGSRDLTVRMLATVEEMEEARSIMLLPRLIKIEEASVQIDKKTLAHCRAAVTAMAQASAAVALLVERQPDKEYNGDYRQVGEHDGFPRYSNGSGMHLYRCQEYEQWVFHDHFGAVDECDTPYGLSPLGSDGHTYGPYMSIEARQGPVPTGAREWWLEAREEREFVHGGMKWRVTVRLLTEELLGPIVPPFAVQLQEEACDPVSAMKQAAMKQAAHDFQANLVVLAGRHAGRTAEVAEATARYPVFAVKKAPTARPASRPASQPCRRRARERQQLQQSAEPEPEPESEPRPEPEPKPARCRRRRGLQLRNLCPRVRRQHARRRAANSTEGPPGPLRPWPGDSV
jgi:hypothetical protein